MRHCLIMHSVVFSVRQRTTILFCFVPISKNNSNFNVTTSVLCWSTCTHFRFFCLYVGRQSFCLPPVDYVCRRSPSAWISPTAALIAVTAQVRRCRAPAAPLTPSQALLRPCRAANAKPSASHAICNLLAKPSAIC